ncbi:MAG: tRNA (adenosine(37)-N6)-threonylcarbamoyltransferase complex ATPase subunit type 1 TsaE [Gammaproteobacteria bacterium]
MSMPEQVQKTFVLIDQEDTLAIGRAYAQCLKAPMVIFLEGDLGAGKTTFVRGVLQGLGASDAVLSPTYTLVEEYSTNDFVVHHLDLYRLTKPQDLEGLGFRDRVGHESVVFIEWPERAEPHLPEPDHRIQLSYRDEGRALLILSDSDTEPDIVLR